MTPEYIAERIVALKAQIAAIDTALLAIALDPKKSYTVNTGQTEQTVTKQDAMRLQQVQQSILNQIATLEARLTGNGTYQAVPGW